MTHVYSTTSGGEGGGIGAHLFCNLHGEPFKLFQYFEYTYIYFMCIGSIPRKNRPHFFHNSLDVSPQIAGWNWVFPLLEYF